MGSSYGIFEPWRWHLNRELGQKPLPGDKAGVYSGLYASFRSVQTWEPSKTTDHTHHGGVFNFDFSPDDGSLLVAACERQSILMFDPFSAKLIGYKNKAHSDCVNCIRFLDSRVFASCSDDTTVSLWDVRFLKHEIRTLRGHSNWVKNIEYAADHSLLLTSGFDGSIYTWDINSYSADEPNFKSVFHTSGLMRSKLTPDNSKLIISTTGGYLIVIHNLDLLNLEQDLRGFKPNFYRLMQLNQSPRRSSLMYNHVFERQRNRVEFISDFPGGNDAGVIASLQIHPQGWCALSRNTSNGENSEWTCVHDIQEAKIVDEGDKSAKTRHEASSAGFFEYSPQPSTSGEPSQRGSTSPANSHSHSPDSRSSSPSFILYIRVQSPTPENSGTDDDDGGGGGDNEEDENEDSSDHDCNNVAVSDHDSEEQQSSTDSDSHLRVETRAEGGMRPAEQSSNHMAGDSNNARPVDYTFFLRSGSQKSERTLSIWTGGKPCPSSMYRIHKNYPRLLYHTQEPNVGRGFIKELCFSSDGRLICSPFGFGVRLLAFNPLCQELCDCVPSRPLKLCEVACTMAHTNVVVTAKFSPVHCMFVAGCLNGRVSFHQPVL